MKLLFYGESPMNATGFGQVNKHLLAAFSRVADVTAVCTTHYRYGYNRKKYPYDIIGCELVDVSKRDQTHQRNLPNILKAVQDAKWDVFCFQGDFGWSNDILVEVGLVLQECPEKHAIFYLPIDGDVSHAMAFNILQLCNVPVVYTNHGKSVIERYAPDIAKNVSVIQLGCETEFFYPFTPEQRREARLKRFGPAYMDQFLCINVNRNQPRKDLARCMAAFHQFHEKHPDSSLYMHSVQNDAGGSLTTQATLAGCDVNKRPAEVIFSDLNLANPWTKAQLNEVYNAADCLISTAYGEGWGLTTSEAMAAGTPVVVPANTANLDLLGEQLPGAHFDFERGWGMRTGGDLDHTVFMYANGGGPVASIHTNSFLDTLEYVYYHREEAHAKAQVALAWARENTWERREADWEQLLRLMAKSARKSQSTTK